MKKNFKSGLVVFIVLIVFIAGLSAGNFFIRKTRGNFTPSFSFSTSSDISPKEDRKGPREYKNEYIGALYIEGTIEEANNTYNQKWLLESIDSMANDPKNLGMIIYINSPGGAVYQADQIYLALQNYKTKGKKIYVYQGPMAASGGYYISCAANKIYANRNTLTGSIGVLFGQSLDLTGLFERLGIKSETIHSGKNKNMMNYNEPLTDEQRQIMQSICDECYEQFVSIVVSQRHISFDQAYKLCDGRIYTANQALEHGLIDKIDSWENTIEDFSEELEKPGIAIKTYKYQRKKTTMDLLMGQYSDIKKTEAAAKLGLPVKVLTDLENNSLTPMYLYNGSF